jgi:hypothetical protein
MKERAVDSKQQGVGQENSDEKRLNEQVVKRMEASL